MRAGGGGGGGGGGAGEGGAGEDEDGGGDGGEDGDADGPSSGNTLRWWQQADVYSFGLVVWQLVAVQWGPFAGIVSLSNERQYMERDTAIRRKVCAEGLRPWGNTATKQPNEQAIDHHLWRRPGCCRGLLVLSRRCSHACVAPGERPEAEALVAVAEARALL